MNDRPQTHVWEMPIISLLFFLFFLIHIQTTFVIVMCRFSTYFIS